MRARLYRHQGSWSLVADEGPRKGRVVDVVDGVVLTDATFVVLEAGRNKVLKDRKPNPHAFVLGTVARTYPLRTLRDTVDGVTLAPALRAGVRVGYDPHRFASFVREDCGQGVFASSAVVATPAGLYAALPACRPRRGMGELATILAPVQPFDLNRFNG